MIEFPKMNCIVAICLLLSLTPVPLQAARILVIGDSWARPTAQALRQVLDENGHTNIAVKVTPFKGYAWELALESGLETISAWLDEWPDTKIIHLSSGANDMGRIWTPSMAGTQQESQLLTQIMNDVETVADHISLIRPDIRILWSSYDYFRRINEQAPAETNGIYLAMANRSEQLVQDRTMDITEKIYALRCLSLQPIDISRGKPGITGNGQLVFVTQFPGQLPPGIQHGLRQQLAILKHLGQRFAGRLGSRLKVVQIHRHSIGLAEVDRGINALD